MFLKTFMISENKIIIEFRKYFLMSIMNMINSRGPRIDSFGTPDGLVLHCNILIAL